MDKPILIASLCNAFSAIAFAAWFNVHVYQREAQYVPSDAAGLEAMGRQIQRENALGIMRYLAYVLAFTLVGIVVAFMFRKIEKRNPWSRPLLIVGYVGGMLLMEYTFCSPYGGYCK